MSTWGDIIADALREIGVYNPIDTLTAEDGAQGARRLNRLLDSWSARRAFAYASEFELYSLTANTDPVLIGPNLSAPNFATPLAAPRPTRILSASLVLNTLTPATEQPIHIRDSAWWSNQRNKAIASTVPTDLYYQPLLGSGALNFWPVPSFNYQVRLELELQLAQIPLTGAGLPNFSAAFSAPQAYELALVYTLAEVSCAPYGKPTPAALPEIARRARAAVLMNNLASPRTPSVDWGTRGGGRAGRADFNWAAGLPE